MPIKYLLALSLFTALFAGSAVAKEAAVFSELPAKAGCVQLYLLRPKQFLGSGIKPLVIIDGVELGRLAGGRSMALYIRPGVHTFATKLSWSNLPMKGGTQQIEVTENGALYLCYSPDYSASEKPGYIVYRNGFIQPDEEFSKTTIKQSTPLTLDPEVLLKAKPKI